MLTPLTRSGALVPRLSAVARLPYVEGATAHAAIAGPTVLDDFTPHAVTCAA